MPPLTCIPPYFLHCPCPFPHWFPTWGFHSNSHLQFYSFSVASSLPISMPISVYHIPCWLRCLFHISFHSNSYPIPFFTFPSSTDPHWIHSFKKVGDFNRSSLPCWERVDLRLVRIKFDCVFPVWCILLKLMYEFIVSLKRWFRRLLSTNAVALSTFAEQ